MMTQAPYIPITSVGGSYFIFNAPHVAEIRSRYGVPGMLVGTLPQANQQNVFLGLPLSLMTEEARLLCEMGVAFIVDDQSWHDQSIRELDHNPDAKQPWLTTLGLIGHHVSRELENQKLVEKHKAIGKLGENARMKKEQRAKDKQAKLVAKSQIHADTAAHDPRTTALFQPKEPSTAPVQASGENLGSQSLNKFTPDPLGTVDKHLDVHTITPTTSYPPLSQSSHSSNSPLPPVTPSYPLFKYLHSLSYFMSPGLRFGCQYMAYPGDPLRFHSHFMVIGRDWDQEVDLMTLIGVGRLGTGVKKGVLMGGVETPRDQRKGTRKMGESEGDYNKRDGVDKEEEEIDESVRCFTIEWGGM